MPIETTEDRSQRLMDQNGQLTGAEMTDLEESGHIIAGRSRAAIKVSEELRQSGEEMKKEAGRLLVLADEIAADVELRQEIDAAGTVGRPVVKRFSDTEETKSQSNKGRE